MSLQTYIGALLTWVLVVVWLFGRPEIFKASISMSSCLKSHAVFFKRYDVDSLPKLATCRFCFGNFGKFPKVFAAHALFPFRQCVGWGPGIASQQALPIGQWTYCESPKRMRSPARLTWVKGIEISAEYNDSARQLEQWYVASPKELEPVKQRLWRHKNH